MNMVPQDTRMRPASRVATLVCQRIASMHLQYMYSNFTVHYTLDKPPRSGWKGSKGFVTADMVKAHAPAPGDDTMVLVCGYRLHLSWVQNSSGTYQHAITEG